MLCAKVRDELGVPPPKVQPLRSVAGLDDLQRARQHAAKREQLAIQRLGLARLELRAEKRLDRLRIGHVLARERGERLELLSTSLPRRFGDARIDVIREELKGPLLEVLLAHEEQRRARREQRDGSSDLQRVGR